MTRRVAVVGGGISGLVAARRLAVSCEVTVFEAASSFGGKLRTCSFRGRPLDLGPDSFITRTPDAETLCRELGLGDELLAPTSATAAIFVRGELRPFPSGLVLGIPTDLRALRAAGVVSQKAVLRAAFDLFDPRRSTFSMRKGESMTDPTVAEVVGRRLGREVLYGLADPLIGGINASDVDVLSFSSAAPQLAAAVTGRSSLLRALRPLAERAREQAGPAFYGLSGGLSSLIDALVSELEHKGVRLVAKRPLNAVRAPQSGTGFELDFGDDRAPFDAVVLALPAGSAAVVLESLDPALASECATIGAASVATVTLAWPSEVVPAHLRSAFERIAARSPRRLEPLAPGSLPGNGVLVPRASRRLVTAATFTSTKWPRSAREGEVVVRASVGRHHDEAAMALCDEELVMAVRADLEVILGITKAPLEVMIKRWPDSFPQYVSGHAALVERIEAQLEAHAGLSLCGASYRGIGIPACVRDGERAARRVLGAAD